MATAAKPSTANEGKKYQFAATSSYTPESTLRPYLATVSVTATCDAWYSHTAIASDATLATASIHAANFTDVAIVI
jgi:hypothetical protein